MVSCYAASGGSFILVPPGSYSFVFEVVFQGFSYIPMDRFPVYEKHIGELIFHKVEVPSQCSVVCCFFGPPVCTFVSYGLGVPVACMRAYVFDFSDCANRITHFHCFLYCP